MLCPACKNAVKPAEEPTCMACDGNERMRQGATHLDDLPPHKVLKKGKDSAGQRYVKVEYEDGTEALIAPLPRKRS